MAGGVFSSALLNGMTIRESATDGSDFTNPAADYRRLFLGEDGLLHLKDSAGAVTDIGSGGSVATDAIWDAKGDLAGGTGANTAQKLTAGTNGHVLIAASGETTGLMWGQPAGMLLARTVDTSGGSPSTTSATQADIDATNAIVTFTAPASGNVKVRVGIEINMDGASNQNGYIGLRESTTDVVNKQFAIQCPNGVGVEQICWVEMTVTGISAGSHTYKAAFAVNGGITMTVRHSSTSPLIMEVYAL